MNFDDQADVLFGHAHINTGKLDKNNPFAVASVQPWKRHYERSSGILEVDVDMTSLADEFDLSKNDLGKSLCQPDNMCSWDNGKNQCEWNIQDKDNYLYDACDEKKADSADQPGCAVDCVAKPNDPHCIDAILQLGGQGPGLFKGRLSGIPGNASRRFPNSFRRLPRESRMQSAARNRGVCC